MTLRMTTAGESHGPALVAIVSGLPAGLVLERAAIDADLQRRQQGYGRSPRQQIETDEVEVLAGLRHGRTLGTPLALFVRNRDHRNALERASARHTAVIVAAGAVAKALLREIEVDVEGAAHPEHGADPDAVDAARADRDTLGGIVEVTARGVPP